MRDKGSVVVHIDMTDVEGVWDGMGGWLGGCRVGWVDGSV